MPDQSKYLKVEEAISLLQDGEVVAIPTETVYGLAADAANEEAIRMIYEIKNRPADNPLICHADTVDMIRQYVVPLDPSIELLLLNFTPGPLSLLMELNLEQGQKLKFATGERDNVVMRIPDHKIFLDIIHGVGNPIAAPSANTSGKVSPTNAKMVAEDIGGKISGIVDGGNCEVGIESTILDVRDPQNLKILRPGFIGIEELRDVLKTNFPTVQIVNALPESETIPGNKYAHYAPEIPVVWKSLDEIIPNDIPDDVVVTGMTEDLTSIQCKHKFSLGSLDTNEKEVAKNLYSNLKLLDEFPVKEAWLIRFKNNQSSISNAVLNRLSKVAK